MSKSTGYKYSIPKGSGCKETLDWNHQLQFRCLKKTPILFPLPIKPWLVRCSGRLFHLSLRRCVDLEFSVPKQHVEGLPNKHGFMKRIPGTLLYRVWNQTNQITIVISFFATIRTPHHFCWTFIFGTPSLHHGPFIFLKVNTQGFLFPRDSSEMTERISKVSRVAIPEWLPGLQGGVHLLCQHPRSHKGLKGLPSWPTSWMMTVDGANPCWI